MDTRQVREWLEAGEGQQVEFKERYNSRVVESLVAFANTAGGQVLVGVDARGRIVGLMDVDQVVESIIRSRLRAECTSKAARSLCGMDDRHGVPPVTRCAP